MRTKVLLVVVLAAVLAVPATGLAQFGHPLKGQWSGQATPVEKPMRLLFDLQWDGKDITGVINPGPNAITVRKVDFDYSNPASWGVKMQAEGKDASGKPVQIMIDGKLENIGAYYRIFHGTWTENGQKREFTVTRN